MARGPKDSILPHPVVFAATFAVTAVAWSLAACLWSSGSRAFAVSAFALGLSLGPCLTGYVPVPQLGDPALDEPPGPAPDQRRNGALRLTLG